MSSFTILTVCTGNVCRSPLAEDLLRLELAGVPGVWVSSVGTHALVGQGVDEPTRQLADRLIPHYDRRHVARQLEIDHVREADLVLALAREHRRAVVEILPRIARNTFTLREFVRLADEVAPDELGVDDPLMTDDLGDRLRSAVDAVAGLRGTLPPLADPSADDVTDPYRQRPEVYEASAAQLVPAVRSVGEFLRRAATGGV